MDNMPVPQSVVSGLPGAQQLLRDTWMVLVGHWKNLARFSVLNVLLGFGVSVIVGFGAFVVVMGVEDSATNWGNIGIFGVALVIGFLIVVTLSFWISAALLEAIRAIRQEGRDLSLGEAFQLGRRRMWALAVVGLWTGLAITGGFILLIIPGIICAVWFVFSSFVFVNENISGTDALRQSKKYVVGRWWAVFGRLITLWVTLWIVSMVADFIFRTIFHFSYTPQPYTAPFSFIPTVAPWYVLLFSIKSFFLSIFSSLMTLVYLQLLYEALRGGGIAEVPLPAPAVTES